MPSTLRESGYALLSVGGWSKHPEAFSDLARLTGAEGLLLGVNLLSLLFGWAQGVDGSEAAKVGNARDEVVADRIFPMPTSA